MIWAARISFVGPFTEMAGGLVSSKAFDDRCCCVAIIKAAEMIKNDWKENHLEPIGLTVLLSAQEETGGLGARTAAFALHPTQAIVVDVTFGTTPEIADKHVPSVGKGPAIGMGAILSRKMSKELIAAAEEEKIPYQLEVMSGGHTGHQRRFNRCCTGRCGKLLRFDSAALYAHPNRNHLGG